jgi:hypothetical protein
MKWLSISMMLFISLLNVSAVFAQSGSNELAEKLVTGSPWQFVTRYENTVHEFRFNDSGELQRKSNRTGSEWKTQVFQSDGTLHYQTVNGHTITFYLTPEGAAAKHSKHGSTFSSMKREPS